MPVIRWLDLAISAVSPRTRDEGLVAAVHPINLNEQRACYGVTLNQRWLCGSDDTLTCFESMLGAMRFLKLLKVEHIVIGGRWDFARTGQAAIQFYRLGTQGLSAQQKMVPPEARRPGVADAAVPDREARARGFKTRRQAERQSV